LVIEPECKGLEHVEFNSAVVSMLRLCYPDSKILFLGDNSHIQALRKKGIDIGCSININTLKVWVTRNILSDLKKMLEWRNFFKHFDVIVILTTSPFLVIFSELLLREKEKIFFWHSILEAILSKSKFLPWKMAFWIRLSFHISSKKSKHIVLGESIRNNFVKILPHAENFLYSIDHPYIFSNEINEIKQLGDKLFFGSVGVASKSKGTDKILELEKVLSKYENYELLLIGKLADFSIPKDSRIRVIGGNNMLEVDEFEKNIEQLNYILYFYPNDSYKLHASGALMDAFKYVKPIIAIRNNYFEYIFKKFDYHIGYLCKDYDELYSTVERIVKNPESESELYIHQQIAIIKARESFRIEALKNDLRRIIEE